MDGELQPARGGRTGEVVWIHVRDPVAELLEGLADLARNARGHRFLKLGVVLAKDLGSGTMSKRSTARRVREGALVREVVPADRASAARTRPVGPSFVRKIQPGYRTQWCVRFGATHHGSYGVLPPVRQHPRLQIIFASVFFDLTDFGEPPEKKCRTPEGVR